MIYCWDEPAETLYFLLIYRKVEQDDLTRQQLKSLRRLVKEEFK